MRVKHGMTDRGVDDPDVDGASGPAPHPSEERRYEATISIDSANNIALVFLPMSALLFVLPHLLRWGTLSMGTVGWLLLIAAYVPSIVLHEALHGLGFRVLAGAPRHAVEFGVRWELLTPFTHASVPVRARAYRWTVALPGVLTGLLPAVAGVGLGIAWLTWWGTLMFVSAAGDCSVLWAIRCVPGRALVLDHPDKVGCYVLVS